MFYATGYEGGDPGEIGVSYPDPNAGIFGAFAIMAALTHRALTGEGQYTHVTTMGCEQRGRGIQNPRSGNNSKNAWLTARARISKCHVGTGLFVAGADSADPTAVLGERVDQAVRLYARQSKNSIDVVRQQALNNSLSASELASFHGGYWTTFCPLRDDSHLAAPGMLRLVTGPVRGGDPLLEVGNARAE